MSKRIAGVQNSPVICNIDNIVKGNFGLQLTPLQRTLSEVRFAQSQRYFLKAFMGKLNSDDALHFAFSHSL